MPHSDNEATLHGVLASSRRALWSVVLFSCAINLLMLTGPLFMLQVYDRVLTSRSVPTLVTLFALVVGLYLFLGLFEFIRSRVLSRLGYRLDVELAAITKHCWVMQGLAPGNSHKRPLNALTTLRHFLGSNGLPALFDLPWIPVYLAIVYLLHVWLGLLATAGAIIVIAAALVGELLTRKPIAEASFWEVRDQHMAENTSRNAEAVVAMGMTGNMIRHWETVRHNGLGKWQAAGGRTEIITASTKATRLLMQSAILALGAYLAIFQEITPGVMIAASILAGRALAPVDAAVGNWKNFIRARQAYKRLREDLGTQREIDNPTVLPDPKGKIEVIKAIKMAAAGHPILQGINFKLAPGDGLGVIGPSASGKSSLARLLVGLSRPEKGEVRFDGATFDQWDKERGGQFIGYLPQSVELLDGTVAQNIARFAEGALDEDIISAAKLAGVHELILKLPNGYQTDLGSDQIVLSGGQSQRIALARALYKVPPLVVLDEPNAHLDVEGDAALTQAIQRLRAAGSSVIVMAHRPSAIAAVNKLLVLNEGRQTDFGEKNKVLTQVTKQVPKPDLRAVDG